MARITACIALFTISLGVPARAESSSLRLVRPESPPSDEMTQPRSKWFGHHLSQSTSILAAGECTAGTQALGCAIGPHLMAGTSPFFYFIYGMPTAFVRACFGGGGESGSDPDYALQVAHAGTGERLNTGFQMSATTAWFIGKLYQTPMTGIFLNVVGAYYWVDTAPYSLRRPQPRPVPYQLSLTTAFNIRLIGSLYLNAETGVLGINENFPHIHNGASLGFRGRYFSGHFGFSYDATLHAFMSGDKADQWLIYKQTRYYSGPSELKAPVISSAQAQNDFGFHPEISLQGFF